MSLTFKREPAGHWFDVAPDFPLANKGTAQGMIYPPGQAHKEWRICYGSCTDHVAHLQGKVSDKPTLESAKAFLESQFRHF